MFVLLIMVELLPITLIFYEWWVITTYKYRMRCSNEWWVIKEKFENTKRVGTGRKSTDKKHNEKRKNKTERTNNLLQKHYTEKNRLSNSNPTKHRE